jgi:short-subunit dehydrogenase
MKIAGSRALSTGASRGIGADIARGLRRRGADVALVARGAGSLDTLAAELGGHAYPTDLTDGTALRGLLDRVETDGPIDILINNAGDEKIGPFDEMDSAALESINALNVVAVAELQRQAIPRMIRRGQGHIVNISSYAGVICPPHLATYAASKAFVTHHTANLAEEFRDTPIGFTKVEIGEVAGTGLMEKGRTDPVFIALVQRLYRLQASRLIRPAEITARTLDAIENDRRSVRLPRRIAASSYLADAPRHLTNLVARDLRRKHARAIDPAATKPS